MPDAVDLAHPADAGVRGCGRLARRPPGRRRRRCAARRPRRRAATRRAAGGRPCTPTGGRGTRTPRCSAGGGGASRGRPRRCASSRPGTRSIPVEDLIQLAMVSLIGDGGDTVVAPCRDAEQGAPGGDDAAGDARARHSTRGRRPGTRHPGRQSWQHVPVTEPAAARRSGCAGCGPSTRRDAPPPGGRGNAAREEREQVVHVHDVGSRPRRARRGTACGRAATTPRRRRRGRRPSGPGSTSSSFVTSCRCTSTPASRSQRTSSSTARFSPDGTRDEYRLWTTRTLIVWPSAHEWTARISDLTLRSPEWSSDGSELGLPCGVGLPVSEQGVPGAAARWGKGHVDGVRRSGRPRHRRLLIGHEARAEGSGWPNDQAGRCGCWCTTSPGIRSRSTSAGRSPGGATPCSTCTAARTPAGRAGSTPATTPTCRSSPCRRASRSPATRRCAG